MVLVEVLLSLLDKVLFAITLVVVIAPDGFIEVSFGCKVEDEEDRLVVVVVGVVAAVIVVVDVIKGDVIPVVGASAVILKPRQDPNVISSSGRPCRIILIALSLWSCFGQALDNFCCC